MAFLDRMVSDLIGRSTGFNARPFVRAVGGKNVLLLGGALVAGALAAEKMRQDAKPASPPPPPPLPELPVPPLPMPQPAGPEEKVSDQSLPNALLYAIVRVMAAGALADGEMHGEERQLIERRLDESGLTPEQIRRIQKDMVIPPGPDELAGMVTTDEDRDLVYRFAALVVLADETVSELERSWLDKLAVAMALGGERREALEREVFEKTPRG